MFISCSFEAKLPEIFKDVHDSYEKIEGRLKAEQFKVRALICPSFRLHKCIQLNIFWTSLYIKVTDHQFVC